MNETECLAACGRLIPHLGEWAQFGWGAFGGVLVLFFGGLSFVAQRNKIKKEKFFPLDKGEVLFIALSLALPFLTGFQRR